MKGFKNLHFSKMYVTDYSAVDVFHVLMSVSTSFQESGSLILLSHAFTSAPFCRRSCTMLLCQFPLAVQIGVIPCVSYSFTLAFFSN